MASTLLRSAPTTSTLAYIPGRRRPSGLPKVARTRTLRVDGSTSGLIVVTAPSQVAPGKVSTVTWVC